LADLRPPSAPRGLSIDALGTLIELEPPAPILADALARAGYPQAEDDVERAIAAEMAYYRTNMQRGADPHSLQRLRQDCARVVAEALSGPVPPNEELTRLLVSSLVFRLHPDVIPTLEALRMADVPVLVLSNWDCSLSTTLGDLGVRGLVDHVLTSAEIGAQKPDANAFAQAVSRLGLEPRDVVHVGDDPHRDAHGAHSFGLTAVLIDREGGTSTGPWTTISSLRELEPLMVPRSRD
jgi:putative hydrolase of the HAD superfamily